MKICFVLLVLALFVACDQTPLLTEIVGNDSIEIDGSRATYHLDGTLVEIEGTQYELTGEGWVEIRLPIRNTQSWIHVDLQEGTNGLKRQLDDGTISSVLVNQTKEQVIAEHGEPRIVDNDVRELAFDSPTLGQFVCRFYLDEVLTIKVYTNDFKYNGIGVGNSQWEVRSEFGLPSSVYGVNLPPSFRQQSESFKV